MCSTSAGWAFGRSVEPCFKHVQSSSERYQLRSAFPNLRRLSVVGCQKSLAWHPAVFSGAIFQSACGWTKTHRWRILYLCKIQHPTNQPVLNFPLSHLALPFWAWPKKVSHLIRLVALCDCVSVKMCELAQAQTKLTSDQNLDILKALMEVLTALKLWRLFFRARLHDLLSLAKCARKLISESQRSNEMPMNLGLEMNYEARWRSVKQVI